MDTIVSRVDDKHDLNICKLLVTPQAEWTLLPQQNQLESYYVARGEKSDDFVYYLQIKALNRKWHRCFLADAETLLTIPLDSVILGTNLCWNIEFAET